MPWSVYCFSPNQICINIYFLIKLSNPELLHKKESVAVVSN
jgi:hypothetical protein